jgi:hypothetical protein
MEQGYGYALNDAIRALLKAEQAPLTIKALAEKLNGYLKFNYPEKSREFTNLRNRTLDQCKALQTGGFVTLTENNTDIKTKYYTVTDKKNGR